MFLQSEQPRLAASAHRARRRARARSAAAVATVGLAVLAGCTTGPTPGGGGTGGTGTGNSSRYRSEVFTRVQKTANIVYSQARGNQPQNMRAPNLTLDLYRPEGDTVTKRPVIITAYGGAFMFGSKDNTGDPAYQMAQHFAKLGYVTANINYRLLAASSGLCTGTTKTPACRNAAIAGISDGIAAVRFLRANADKYGIDPDRIAITGDSAGGVIAAGAGVLANVSFDEFPSPDVNRSTPQASGRVQAFMSISGGMNEDLYIDAEDSPGLLFHGTADTIVPSNYTTFMANAMKKAGVQADVVLYQGAGHVPWGKKADILAKTTDFFYDKLDLANAAK